MAVKTEWHFDFPRLIQRAGGKPRRPPRPRFFRVQAEFGDEGRTGEGGVTGRVRGIFAGNLRRIVFDRQQHAACQHIFILIVAEGKFRTGRFRKIGRRRFRAAPRLRCYRRFGIGTVDNPLAPFHPSNPVEAGRIGAAIPRAQPNSRLKIPVFVVQV